MILKRVKNVPEKLYQNDFKGSNWWITDFYDKEIPKLNSNHTCLAVITLDSVLKKDDSYYPQVFLKECKYIEKKVVWHIYYCLSDFSYSCDESDKE